MALLGFQQSTIGGTGLNFVAADVAGDTFAPNTRGSLIVVNDDAAAHDVTVAVPGNTRYGQAQPDVTVTVPAGATRAVGPFPRDLADPVDGKVHVTYPTGVTAVTVAAVQV